MRRRAVTPEARARAERIARALAGMLNEEPPPRAEEATGAQSREDLPGTAAAGRASDVACPRCGGAMQAVAAGKGVEIDRCGECGAIWLDAGELEALVADQAPPAGTPPPTVGRLREHMRGRIPAEAAVQYRECPRCGEVMRRANFGTISGVVVDECVRHGVLLDPGELEAIEAFVRVGGQALGEEHRLEQGQRALPPAPDSPRPTTSRTSGAVASAAESLWDLLFRW